MKRLILICLVSFLAVFAVLGATLIYVRYGGQDHMPEPIEVVD
jgi:hypothetical protein